MHALSSAPRVGYTGDLAFSPETERAVRGGAPGLEMGLPRGAPRWVYSGSQEGLQGELLHMCTRELRDTETELK